MARPARRRSYVPSVLLVLAALALTSSLAHAQQGTLAGIVVDEVDGAIAGARVTVTGDGGGVAQTTSSDAAGAFVVAATTVRVAVTAGIDLAQVGEFSFILGRSGREVGLLTVDQWQLLLTASIATMILTPALLGAAPAIGEWVGTRFKTQSAPEEDAEPEHQTESCVNPWRPVLANGTPLSVRVARGNP